MVPIGTIAFLAPFPASNKCILKVGGRWDFCQKKKKRLLSEDLTGCTIFLKLLLWLQLLPQHKYLHCDSHFVASYTSCGNHLVAAILCCTHHAMSEF